MKTETEALAIRLSGEPLLEQFMLVGGTALSIYLKHRLSEDLDFATTDKTLPTQAISDLLARFERTGSVIEDILPLAARHDAINEGIDIEDYQQDWLIDGVKLTFFTLDKENGSEKLALDHGEVWCNKLRIASLDTLFVTKALVLTDRHALRDNFDMRSLMTQGSYSYNDLIRAYKTYRPYASLNYPESRLLSKDYPLTDPGLDGLIEESEEEIINNIHVFFTKIIGDYKLDIDKQDENLQIIST